MPLTAREIAPKRRKVPVWPATWRGLGVYIRHFKTFYAAGVILYFPAAALMLAWDLLGWSPVAPGTTTTGGDGGFQTMFQEGQVDLRVGLVPGLVSLVMTLMLFGAVVHGVHLAVSGAPLDVTRLIKRGLARLLPVFFLGSLFLALLIFVVILIGTAFEAAQIAVALILGLMVVFLTVYLAIPLAIAPAISVVDSAGILTSLRRAFRLARRNRLRLLIIFLIHSLFYIALVMLLYVAIMALFLIEAVIGTDYAVLVGGWLGGTMIYGLYVALVTGAYFTLREAKEGAAIATLASVFE